MVKKKLVFTGSAGSYCRGNRNSKKYFSQRHDGKFKYLALSLAQSRQEKAGLKVSY